MITGLNERAIQMLAGLALDELSYCLGLAKRLERLGMSGERVSSALCAVVERGACSPSVR